LSHLPMFHQPHDYQIIVEADLPNNARQIYLQDQVDHPEQTLYTIAPSENFVLPDEVQNLKAFHATLYRGHFERGGIPIAEDIVVQIKRVIYFNHFDPQAVRPDQLTYFIFGHPGEMFMAHRIVAKPDFDQIAEVQLNQALQLTSFKEIYLEFGDLSN